LKQISLHRTKQEKGEATGLSSKFVEITAL
jgi:hypothetical protein